MFFGSFIKLLRGLFHRKPTMEADELATIEISFKSLSRAARDLHRVMGDMSDSLSSPVYKVTTFHGVPTVKRLNGLTVIFNANHKENYDSQGLAAKELSNWFGKHVSRRTIYRALKEKNGNLTVGDRTVIVKYMED